MTCQKGTFLFTDVCRYKQRGKDGPFKSSFANIHDHGKNFLKACEEIGLEACPDFNRPEGPLGYGRFLAQVFLFS